MTGPIAPSEEGFLGFIRGSMGIPSSALPDDSPYITLAYAVAIEMVLDAIRSFPATYVLAVYNFAGNNLINYAADQPGSTYFQTLRDKFNINGFVSGVVQSTNDEGTGMSLVVMEAAKNFTLGDLQNLKTPWGRNYLAIAQDYGTLWGLS